MVIFLLTADSHVYIAPEGCATHVRRSHERDAEADLEANNYGLDGRPDTISSRRSLQRKFPTSQGRSA